MKNKNFKYLDAITAFFVTVLLLSNLLSSAKIVDLGVTLFNFPLIFDGGLIIFPLCYILGDVLTEVYGYSRARRTIWFGFIASSLMAIAVNAIGRLPAEQYWAETTGDVAYSSILGGLASGGIIIASLSAYFFGEFSNSYLLAKLKIYTNGKHLWFRAMCGTLVGQGLDTVIFMLIAAAFGVFPWEIIPGLILANYIFKVSIEVFLLPGTYGLTKFLKKAEGIDSYDRKISFNPFALSN